MSLIVFSAGSRISQGLIKHLHQTGNFDKIVCADVFPGYSTYERYFRFKDQLDPNSKTQVTEAKIFQKSELTNLFKEATHVVYCTHDHYKVVPAKENLLKLTSELTASHANIQKAVFVTPTEYENYQEPDVIDSSIKSEQNALATAGDKSLLIRSDLTFGPFSQLVHNTLLAKVLSGSSIAYAGHSARRNPISINDLAKIVENGLASSETGKAFYAKGAKDYNYAEIIGVFEQMSGKKANLNQDMLQKVFSPLSANLVSEMLYTGCYQNCMRIMDNKRDHQPSEYGDASELLGAGVEMEAFEMFYGKGYFESMKGAGPAKKGWVEKVLY